MKKLENLKGAQKLSENELKAINGSGVRPCGLSPFTYIPITPSSNNNEAFCLAIHPNCEWNSGKCYFCHY